MTARINLFIVLILGALLLAACGAPASSTPPAPTTPPATNTPQEEPAPDQPAANTPEDLVNTTWNLTDINGTPALENDAPNEVVFTEEGQVAGTAGCNRFFGPVSGSAGTISFGPLGSTMMACSEELMAQETTVFGLLERAVSYTIAGDTLTITTDDGATLTLTRV